jgi:hypothetical protein
LQHGFSMRESEILVKRLDTLTMFFSCHGSRDSPTAPK